MVHGGYETGTRTWNTSMSKWLADNGFVVLNIDYRLAPTWVYPAPENDIMAGPALLTEWGRVTVSWWTHKIKGLHRNDFVMAAKTDALAES